MVGRYGISESASVFLAKTINGLDSELYTSSADNKIFWTIDLSMLDVAH